MVMVAMPRTTVMASAGSRNCHTDTPVARMTTSSWVLVSQT